MPCRLVRYPPDYVRSSPPRSQNYFFWTWKIGNSTATGKVETPFWSYQLALEHGWAPTDPRDADGQCDRIGAGFTDSLASSSHGKSVAMVRIPSPPSTTTSGL
jgi:glucan 1,3-beta-glucosidase